VAILTVHASELSILLVQRADHPYRGYWALPGGFLRDREGLDAAAARELAEETGLEAATGRLHLEQLGSYGMPGRDPRMRVVTVAYLALVPNVPLARAGGDAAEVRLWPIRDLAAAKAPKLAFDHASIVTDAIERARAKLEYSSVATAFLEQPFTLSQLRGVYEAVWGVKLDPANFRRKVLTTPGLVRPLGAHEQRTSAGRPAELYKAGPATELTPPLSRTAATSSTTSAASHRQRTNTGRRNRSSRAS
jgi:8-oxo-dGTP diphosphatase